MMTRRFKFACQRYSDTFCVGKYQPARQCPIFGVALPRGLRLIPDALSPDWTIEQVVRTAASRLHFGKRQQPYGQAVQIRNGSLTSS